MRLRLPNALVLLSGQIPGEVFHELGDLEDGRLHLDLAAPVVKIDVVRHDAGWFVTSESDRRDVPLAMSAGPAPADLLDAILMSLNRMSYGTDPLRLHLHAAAVGYMGLGILLAGPSGSGKSTLTVELLIRGASYLTDENLTLLPGSRTIFAYPKPITLKAGSLRYFRNKGPSGRLNIPEAARNDRSHIRATSIGAVSPFAQPGVFVAVRYSADDEPSLRRISTAEACTHLLEDSLDGVRLGPSALDVVATTLSGATAWELRYSNAAAAAALITELRPPLRRQLTVFHDYRHREPAKDSHACASDDDVSSDHSVRIARFDDSAALHDGRSRALMTLTQVEVDELGRRDRTDAPDQQRTERRQSVLKRVVETIGDLAKEDLGPDADPTMSFGLPNRTTASTKPSGGRPTKTLGNAGDQPHQPSGLVVEQIGRGMVQANEDVTTLAHQRHLEEQAICLQQERKLAVVVDRLEALGLSPIVTGDSVTSHDGSSLPHLADLRSIGLLLPPEQLGPATEELSRHATQLAEPQESFASVGGLAPERGTRLRLACPVVGPRSDLGLVVCHTLSPTPYGELVDTDELHARSVPVLVNGRWYRALHPEHRFLHSCLNAVFADPPDLKELREVVMTAPRTPASAGSMMATADRWMLRPVVQRAVRLSESAFPRALPGSLLDEIGASSADPLGALLLNTLKSRNVAIARVGSSTLVRLPRFRHQWRQLGRKAGRVGFRQPRASQTR